MMDWRFPALLRRSLIAQITILSLIFLAAALSYFVIAPYWTYLREEPLLHTRGMVYSEIYDALRSEAGQGPEALAGSQILAEVAAANPGFRLFVRQDERQAQLGGPPQWLESMDLILAQGLAETESRSGDCAATSSWSASFAADGLPARVSYHSCDGKVSYIETAGITTPIARSRSYVSTLAFMSFWQQSRNPLIVALGMFLIAALVLLFAARSLARLTRLVRSSGSRDDSHRLPEAGLPTEVLPLVRTVNQLIEKVEAAAEQQAFFLATAAHELRTPMAILRTRLEELPDGLAKDAVREDVRRIIALVEELLRLMSIRSSAALQGEADLVAVAKTAVAKMAPLSVDRGVELELEAEMERLAVKGEPSLLEVALTNLIDNALSFSKPGDALRVSIDAGRRIAVHDQGPGLAEKTLETLFEPFAKNPPNRRGHGLGLAIVSAVMKLHGGTVSARNNGQGATFALQF